MKYPFSSLPLSLVLGAFVSITHHATAQTLVVSPVVLEFQMQADSGILPLPQKIQITSPLGKVPFFIAIGPNGIKFTDPVFASADPSSGTTPATVTISLMPKVLSWGYGGYYQTIGIGSSAGEPASGFVNFLVDLPAPPAVKSIVNAASLLPDISPGTVVTILVSGRGTKPEFVYQVPDVRFPSPVVPLLRYSKPVDVIGAPDWPKNVPADLESRLTALFTVVLHLPKAVPAVSRFIRVAVSYEFILAGKEPAERTVAGAEADVKPSSIATRTPVLLRPKFEFKSDQDLAGGFCAHLASALNQWLQDNQAKSSGGHWALDLSLYASETSSTAPPLLEITNLRLPV